MMVSVAEKVTVCPSAMIWSTLIKLVEQLSGVIWTSYLPMTTNRSMVSISPLPY